MPNMDGSEGISKPVPQKRKRSRNGCLSCKKLKIKCDEEKPACEYCVSTGRQCIYNNTNSESIKKTSSRSASPNDIYSWKNSSSTSSSPDSSNSNRDLLVFSRIDTKIQKIVNSTSRQLNITNFEYRLLHFFQVFCVPLFSFGKNPKIERVWTYEVPKIWQTSELVRQSVFLFAALNMWPLCNFDELLDPSKPLNRFQSLEDFSSSSLTNVKLTTVTGVHGENNRKENLYLATATYFNKCVFMSNEKTLDLIIDGIAQEVKEGSIVGIDGNLEIDKRKELIVSGIIIFSFLGLHPHNVVPLVSFNDEDETDFLSICVNIRRIITSSLAIMRGSSIDGFFLFKEFKIEDIPKEHLNYPIINQLFESLDNWVKSEDLENVIDSNTSAEIEVYKDVIKQLHLSLFNAASVNYPIPVFRWILVLNGDFEKYVRNERPIALKILYIFACLCLLNRFLLFRFKNMWYDYVKWYKKYIFSKYGGWTDTIESLWYNLAIESAFEIKINHFHILSTLDPRCPNLDNFDESEM